MVDFRRLLTAEQRAKWDEHDHFVEKQKKRYAEMTNENLVASAKYCMAQMSEPYEYPPGMPVYNSAFYHAIVPEILKRLEELDGR